MMSLLDDSVCLSPFAPVVSLDGLMSPEAGGDTPTFDIPDRAPDPAARLDALRAADAVHGFLAELPEKQRDLLVRLYWHGESQASVARSFGVSGAAISKSLTKVLDHGRKRLSVYRNTDLNLLLAA